MGRRIVNVTGKPEAFDDTIRECIVEAMVVQMGAGMANGLERMLQGADKQAYEALKRSEYRDDFIRRYGYTEADLYGKHSLYSMRADYADPSTHEGFGCWVVEPKGLVHEVVTDGLGTIIREDTHHDPHYVGEHRAVEGWAG